MAEGNGKKPPNALAEGVNHSNARKGKRNRENKVTIQKNNQNPPNFCCPRQARRDNNRIVGAEEGERSVKPQPHAKGARGVSNTTEGEAAFRKAHQPKAITAGIYLSTK